MRVMGCTQPTYTNEDIYDLLEQLRKDYVPAIEMTQDRIKKGK